MNNSSLTTRLILGAVLGAAAAALAFLGNPANMALCIACFIRDTAGAMKLHQAAVCSMCGLRSSELWWERS